MCNAAQSDSIQLDNVMLVWIYIYHAKVFLYVSSLGRVCNTQKDTLKHTPMFTLLLSDVRTLLLDLLSRYKQIRVFL